MSLNAGNDALERMQRIAMGRIQFIRPTASDCWQIASLQLRCRSLRDDHCLGSLLSPPVPAAKRTLSELCTVRRFQEHPNIEEIQLMIRPSPQTLSDPFVRIGGRWRLKWLWISSLNVINIINRNTLRIFQIHKWLAVPSRLGRCVTTELPRHPATHGYAWLRMATHGYAWLRMATHPT